jgi:pimeloyl-ACP methyl ester carboxylesterase
MGDKPMPEKLPREAGRTAWRVEPAPVGLQLHCWGASLNGGYGWWYNAEKGDILIASNQIPYDWWTGYHELYWKGPRKRGEWQKGVVHPYSTTRMLAFLDWVATRWDVDLTRTHTAGNSMGGSGSPMFAIRYPDKVAWAIGWVGVHNPAKTPQFKGSYARCYGEPEWGIKFEDGTPVWDYYNDAWYLRQHPDKEIGFITFSNGKNDGAIGWPQAVEFFRALQDTRRPHLFRWAMGGHGVRAMMPVTLAERVLPIDIRVDQSLPAFTKCSLDDDPGNGEQKDGDPKGQANAYLYWETKDIVDEAGKWEMTVGLIAKAPEDECTVDITPRRCQAFKPKPGGKVKWTNTAVAGEPAVQTGGATADKWGLVTLEKVKVSKAKHRISITR